MHDERMALSQSVWADLDALVLEEVNALNPPRDTRSAPPTFSSEDDFVAQAVAYLRQRDEPLRVIEDLTKELGLSMSQDLEFPEDIEPPEDLERQDDLQPPDHAPAPDGPDVPAAALAPVTPGDAAASPQPGPEP